MFTRTKKSRSLQGEKSSNNLHLIQVENLLRLKPWQVFFLLVFIVLYYQTCSKQSILSWFSRFNLFSIVWYGFIVQWSKQGKYKPVKLNTVKLNTVKLNTVKLNTVKLNTVKLNTVKLNTQIFIYSDNIIFQAGR
jgi:hypothetical protein